MRAVLFFIWATLLVHATAQDYQHSLPFPLKSLDIFAPIHESVKNPECKRHSEAFLKDLKELKLWAVKMYDASGKISSGLLNGNVIWLGDDRECFSVASIPNAAENDPDNIQGQYCVVRIFVEPRDPKGTKYKDLPEIYDYIHTHHVFRHSLGNQAIFFPTFSPLVLGLCIPRSCSYEDLEAAFTEYMAPLNSSDVEIGLQINSESCYKKGHGKFEAQTLALIYVCVGMTLLGIAGAIYEYKKEKTMKVETYNVENEGKLMRIFLAFSFRSNMRVLLDTKTQIDEIGCLHGIRAFFSVILYLLHKGIIVIAGSISNREDIAHFLDGPKSMILRSFWNNVDTFVVMSGLLTSYYAVKKLQEGKKINILRMYLQRYLKFTPILFVCVLWVAYGAEYFISDANYARTFHAYSKSCREGWFKSITYRNTGSGFDKMCYQPSHQLETDMQMYLLSPFLILLLWKTKAFGVSCILALIAYLSILKYKLVIDEKLATVVFYGIDLKQLVKSADILYLTFTQRLVPYFCGILLGYFLRIRRKDFKFPKVVILMGSLAALWSTYYSFYGMSHASLPGYVYNSKESAIFATFQPLVWCFAICWFILLCTLGQAEWINRKLKWQGFQVTSRLNVAFYLVQIPIMMMELSRNPNALNFSVISLFDLNVLFACVAFAIWLTLLFLLPIGSLWKLFTEESKPLSKEIKDK